MALSHDGNILFGCKPDENNTIIPRGKDVGTETLPPPPPYILHSFSCENPQTDAQILIVFHLSI